MPKKKTAKKKAKRRERIVIDASDTVDAPACTQEPPSKRLDNTEIAHALSVAQTDRQRMAIMQLLDDSIENAIAQSEHIAMLPQSHPLFTAVGGQTALRAFKEALEEKYEKAFEVLLEVGKEPQPKGYG